jgi:hypothetical protein
MIVTMAYDEDLANRIRELIASENGYTEQAVGGERRGWPDDPPLQGGDRGSPSQVRDL